MSDHDKLTDEQLDELEHLEKAATVGPWEWDEWGKCVAKNVDEPFEQTIIETDMEYYPPRENDRSFLVALRNAAPALIAELRTLRKLRDEVEPVLREGKRCLCPNMMQESFEGHLLDCLFVRARNILARYYDKKEPTK